MTEDNARALPRFRVLIVDDEPAFTADLAGFLGTRYDVGVAHDGEEAMRQVAALRPDVVLLDITLATRDEGFAVLERIRRRDDAPEVIMLTGMRETDAVVRAIKAGAFHYVLKPPVLSELMNLINRAAASICDARRLAALESERVRLGGKFVVCGPAMQRVVRELEKVAGTDATVMIVGESGTGKELVARHIHELSRRAAGPFVAVNCAAIPEHLIESELFGHVKGAFTGAGTSRPGRFVAANGGTLLLDEIGDMPAAAQTKLLRVLQEGAFEPVGSDRTVTVDVRIVAATHRDLQKLVAVGDFREDLFYRLNVFPVALPPLRKRPDEILPLAEHFLKLYADQIGRREMRLSPAAQAHLQVQDWRGNVRDLRNAMERAVIRADGGVVGVEHLGADGHVWDDELPPYKDAKAAAIERFQRSYIPRLLRESGGNRSEAARRAGLTRKALHEIIRDLGLADDFADDEIS